MGGREATIVICIFHPEISQHYSTCTTRAILRWGEVAKNDPAFLQSLRISVTDSPSPIFHTILTCEKEKMSQPFSHNINSLNNYAAINFIVADHDLISYPGYPHSIPSHDIKTSRRAESKI